MSAPVSPGVEPTPTPQHGTKRAGLSWVTLLVTIIIFLMVGCANAQNVIITFSDQGCSSPAASDNGNTPDTTSDNGNTPDATSDNGNTPDATSQQINTALNNAGMSSLPVTDISGTCDGCG